MSKTLKRNILLVLFALGFLLLGVTQVNAVEEYTGEFRKISTDGTWTVNAFKPEDAEDVDFLLTAIANDYIDTTRYYAYASVENHENPDVTRVSVTVMKITDEEEPSESQEHVLTVTYNEPDADSLSKVNGVINKMKKYDSQGSMTIQSSYKLDDLYLINYLNTNSKGFEEHAGNGMALNFAKDLILATNGNNIHFRFDARAGQGVPTELFNFAMGQVIVYYNGVAYTSMDAAITANNIIHIPNTTAETTDAYEAAVLKRITDYLGTSEGITVELGGTLESLNYEEERWGENEEGEWVSLGMFDATYNDEGLIDTSKSDGNYYNITINGKTYRFAVLAEDASKLETPKYRGSDVLTDISITSDVTTIPLDASLTVRSVVNKSIEAALGTKDYSAYDISLYSNFKKADIKKLDDGKFLVSIPVPEKLNGKEIVAYYITTTGEKQEHTVTVKSGFASFETDHFSTYILAEKSLEKDETPKTGVTEYIEFISVIGILALLGTVSLKKQKNNI